MTVAVRLETIEGPAQLVRFYDCDEPDALAPYEASCVLEWSGPREAWVKGMTGRLTRRTVREFVNLLVSLAVHTVVARRGEGHVLPGGVAGDDGTVRIDVGQLADRFARAGASQWADLPGVASGVAPAPRDLSSL